MLLECEMKRAYLAVSTIILTMNPTKKTTATEAKMRPKRVLLFFCSGVVDMMLVCFH